MFKRIIYLFKKLGSFLDRNEAEKESIQLPSKKLYRKFYSFSDVLEVPEEIEESVLYYVGDKGFKWVLIFKCPCGCHEIIQLNLLKEASPGWRVKFHDDGDVSIYPSVNRNINCRSHFNITRNSVRWWEWLEDWR
jgi:hypothetical protein